MMTTDYFSFENARYLDAENTLVRVNIGALDAQIHAGSGDIWRELQEKVAEGLLVIAPYAPEPVSREDVTKERDRRINGVMLFNGHLIEVDEVSKARINAAVTLATAARERGRAPDALDWMEPDGVFQWITADNQLVPMDLETVINMGQATALRERDHIFAAYRLKMQSPIPDDYQDDKHWPKRS